MSKLLRTEWIAILWMSTGINLLWSALGMFNTLDLVLTPLCVWIGGHFGVWLANRGRNSE